MRSTGTEAHVDCPFSYSPAPGKVPCSKCVSRGCGAICPEATLARKGNRLVLSSATNLHDRIDVLTTRIRTLEDALRLLQDPHPLLTPELLAIKHPTDSSEPDKEAIPLLDQTSSNQVTSATISPKDSVEENSYSRRENENVSASPLSLETSKPSADEELSDVFGTLTLGSFGESAFLGRTARADFLISAIGKIEDHDMDKQPHAVPTVLPPCVTNASFHDDDSLPPLDLVQAVYSMLPSLSEATRLCDYYMKAGEWMFVAPLSREEVYDDVISTVYIRNPGQQDKNPHTLALLFVMLALGTIYDECRPPLSPIAMDYFYCARAALTFVSPLRYATIESVQTLGHMALFLYLFDWDALPSSSAWIYLGFAMRLATSIGLHLDNSRWNLSEKEIQRRSRIFWSLYSLDIHASFGLGRPPGLSPAFVDCPFPPNTADKPEDGATEVGYHTWTVKWLLFLHEVMSTAFGTAIPQYPTIIDLDRRIRDFHIPEYLRVHCDDMSASGKLLTQRYWVLALKEETLLNLHRSHFALALKEMPNDPLRHKYAASVLATYRSAWRLIEGLSMSWKHPPREFLARTSLPWSLALSSCLALCLLVVRSPGSNLTQTALSTLDCAANLFEAAAPVCKSAADNYECIKEIRDKAYNTAFKLGPAPDNVLLSELDRLGGKTHLLRTPQSPSHRSPSDSPPKPACVEPTGTTNSAHNPNIPMVIDESGLSALFSPSFFTNIPFSLGSGAVVDNTPANMDNLHPTIVQDMNNLEGSDVFNVAPAGMEFALQDFVLRDMDFRLDAFGMGYSQSRSIHESSERHS